MNQEDMLVLLVVFVLGFVVSRMMSGRLVEGVNVGDACTNDSDCKGLPDCGDDWYCPIVGGCNQSVCEQKKCQCD